MTPDPNYVPPKRHGTSQRMARECRRTNGGACDLCQPYIEKMMAVDRLRDGIAAAARPYRARPHTSGAPRPESVPESVLATQRTRERGALVLAGLRAQARRELRQAAPQPLSVGCSCGWRYVGTVAEAMAQNRLHRAEHLEASMA